MLIKIRIAAVKLKPATGEFKLAFFFLCSLTVFKQGKKSAILMKYLVHLKSIP